MGVEIETDVPLPNERCALGIPFEHMQPGDSVFLADRVTAEVCTAYYRYTKHEADAGRHVKFTARKASKGDTQGVRLWRIE